MYQLIIIIIIFQVAEEFKKKQEHVEETEGSIVYDSDCENSSEDNSSNEKQNLNEVFKSVNIIPVRRKRTLGNDSDNEPKPKKSNNTINLESFNLVPRVVLEKLDITSKGSINLKKIPDKIIVTDNTNDNSNKNTINSQEVTDNISKTVIDNSINHDQNLEDCTDDENDALVIDEGAASIDCDDDNDDETVTKEHQNDEVQKVGAKNDMQISTITIDGENNEPIIIEPDLILKEDKGPVKDVIEINEHDDSDVEITSCDTPKVPVLNKKSLETIIKASMFKL